MKRTWSICLAVFLLSGCGFRPIYPQGEMPGTSVPEADPVETHGTEPVPEADAFPAATGSRLSPRGCDFAFGGTDALLILVTEDGGETWSIQE